MSRTQDAPSALRTVNPCTIFTAPIPNQVTASVHRERFVASGATATVNFAVVAGGPVAVKQYQLITSPLDFNQFLEEAAILGSLDHPNVIRFVGVLDDPGRLCLVTSWMQNSELNDYVKRRPDAPKRSLARQLLNGLRYLRQQRVVHGDLKGSNILIDGLGHPHIADFGSAFIERTGGTCRWMAPELLVPRFGNSCGPATFESDVFAFGMVLFEIFSGGEIPFNNQLTSMAANVAIVEGRRPERPSQTPDDIWAVATACWRTDPASRPPISTVVIQEVET
ncbi:kinase-like domain-containing protein [Mycena crocata]|nr:kinase-like domain-containing protein [Mycena crocata]